jgi:hypothetical protein
MEGDQDDPSSYFYKNVYRRAWLDPDIEAAMERSTSHQGGHSMWRDFAALITHHTSRDAPQPKLNPIEQ